MDATAKYLEEMAAFIAAYGLHTGDQFAAINPHTGLLQLDICAIAYHVTENGNTPDAFFTDEGTARDLIEGNAAAMDCIRAISAAIANYEVPDSDGRPDLIEHVSQWTFTPPIGEKQPPSIDEVIGCILRAGQIPTARIPDDIARRITEDSLDGPLPTWAKYEDRDADVWHLTNQTHDGDRVMLPSAGGTPLMLRRDAERLYGPFTPTA